MVPVVGGLDKPHRQRDSTLQKAKLGDTVTILGYSSGHRRRIVMPHDGHKATVRDARRRFLSPGHKSMEFMYLVACTCGAELWIYTGELSREGWVPRKSEKYKHLLKVPEHDARPMLAVRSQLGVNECPRCGGYITHDLPYESDVSCVNCGWCGNTKQLSSSEIKEIDANLSKRSILTTNYPVGTGKPPLSGAQRKKRRKAREENRQKAQ